MLYPVELQAQSLRDQAGRGRGIRTPDILLPKQARYQTALYPESIENLRQPVIFRKARDGTFAGCRQSIRRGLPGTPRSTLFPASMPRASVPVKQKGAEAPFEANGAPGEIRTPDHQVRSLVLYPTELRARAASISPTAPCAAAEKRNYSEPDRLRQHPPCNACVSTRRQRRPARGSGIPATDTPRGVRARVLPFRAIVPPCRADSAPGPGLPMTVPHRLTTASAPRGISA